jgi:hypothetical protein
MKLRALSPSVRGGLSKFGQLCLRGMVIHVPADLTHIQTELPRNFSTDDTVTVNVKQRLRYKGCYETENVRPYKILKALQYLVSHDTLWKDAGVQLRAEFAPMLEAAVQDDNAVESKGNGSMKLHQSDPEDACSEDEASSEGDDPDVHAFGNETLLDAGTDSGNIRDAVKNVAPVEGQRPISVYLDKFAKAMASPDIFGGYARSANPYMLRLCLVKSNRTLDSYS